MATDPGNRWADRDEQLEDIAERKSFLNLSPDDESQLSHTNGFSKENVDSIIEGLYSHMLTFAELRGFFPDQAVIEHVKAMQKEYFLGLTAGDYGPSYVDNRRAIGNTHFRIGLTPKWYMGAYAYYLTSILSRLSSEPGQTVNAMTDSLMALIKIIFFDMGLAIDAYMQPTQELVARQRESILELSTPVLSLWDGILVAPIIGAMDTWRARQVMESMLETIVETESTVAILDVTGLPVVDTQVAAHLVDMTRAAKMLGAKVIVTGISPELAQTLTRLQVDLAEVITRGTLRSGLAEAFTLRDLQVKQRATPPTEVQETGAGAAE